MCRYWKQGIIIVALAMTASPWLVSATLAGKPSGGPTPAQLNPAVAFVAEKAGREDIVVAAADLASETVLTKSLKPRRGGRLEIGSPAWSPDGTSVAFWLRDWLSPSDAPMKLYVARADGSQLTLLRDFSAQPGAQPSFPFDGLNWSPTGKELVYADGAGYFARGLFAIDCDSGTFRPLLLNDDRIGDSALSPDLDPAPGYQGLLATIGNDGDGAHDVFVVPLEADADGYLLPIEPMLFQNVTNAPGTEQLNPSWSPDGTQIAYFDNEELAVLDVAGGQLRILPGGFITSAAAEDRAAWTSDGLALVYRSPAISRTDLAIIAADGAGGPLRYTSTINRTEYAPAWNPQWDPDGPGGF